MFTQPMWNHSILQLLSSQAIMFPNEPRWQTHHRCVDFCCVFVPLNVLRLGGGGRTAINAVNVWVVFLRVIIFLGLGCIDWRLMPLISSARASARVTVMKRISDFLVFICICFVLFSLSLFLFIRAFQCEIS